MNKQPEVTERTRQRFMDAFWSLAAEKPISRISVSEVSRLAGYHRSTFYEYFLDTDDLLSQIEAELLEKIKQAILPRLTADQSLENLFPILFSAMNEKIYLLMGPNGDSGFFSRIKTELIPLMASYLPISNKISNFDYLITFVNSAMLGLLQHWNETGKNISAEEISAMMQNLVLHGLFAYVNPVTEL